MIKGLDAVRTHKHMQTHTHTRAEENTTGPGKHCRGPFASTRADSQQRGRNGEREKE